MFFHHVRRIFTISLFMGLIASAQAIQVTYPLLSFYCNEAVVRNIAGDAVVSFNVYPISDHTNSYSITLDSNKMHYWDLIETLHKRGCFEEDEEELSFVGSH